MLQETSTNVAIIVSLCFIVNVARNMAAMLGWETWWQCWGGNFHPRMYTYFLRSDVRALVIGRPGASSADIHMHVSLLDQELVFNCLVQLRGVR